MSPRRARLLVSPGRHGIGGGARSTRASISVASNVRTVSAVIHGAPIRARLRQFLGPSPPGVADVVGEPHINTVDWPALDEGC